MLRFARLGLVAVGLLAGFAFADTLTTQPSYDDNNGAASQTITAGNTGAPIYIRHFPVSLTAIPGGCPSACTGTMTVQYTTSPFSAIAAGTATWITWTAGTVSSATGDVPWGPIMAVRASAATSNGTFEVVQ